MTYYTIVPPTILVTVGQRILVTIPPSEICEHMKISGRAMYVELLPDGRGAQIYNDDGTPCSGPVLYSDVGIYRRGDEFYTYPAKEVE